MQGTLDFRTLTLATGVLVMALSLAMLWVRLTRRTYPGFDLWVLGSAGAGMTMLTGWNAAGPNSSMVVVSNTLACLSMAWLTAGLEDFLGRRRRLAPQAAAVLLTFATSALFTWASPYPRGRVLAGETVGAAQVAYFLWLVIRGIPPLLGGRNRLLEVALGAELLWTVVRVAILAASLPVPRGLLTSITFLVYPVMTSVLIFALTDLNLQRVEADLQASMDEVRTLRGIIPICSYCKKIRDDQGSWEQVEAYVSRHTDAFFTHGICPRCMSERYPEESQP